MSIFRKLKEKSENKKNTNESALRIMLQFANGEMTTREFWECFKNNKAIRNIIIKDKTIPKYAAHLDPGNYIKGGEKIAFTDSALFLYYYPSKLLERINMGRLIDRNAIFWIVRTYFTSRNYVFEVKNEDAALYRLINVIQPDWLRPEEFDNLLDENFLINIVDSAPENLSKESKEQWCKEKILELFKYDKKIPDWRQPPEWPIIDNVPYVFSHQEPDEEDSCYERYYFYNPQNREMQIVVEQYD